MEEDRCEECWWHYGINGGTCQHESRAGKAEDSYTKPCGWFEPKLKHEERDTWEEYQEMWN